MSTFRTRFENSNEVGVFATLTNSYCLIPHGGKSQFRVFIDELVDIPVVKTTIANTRIVGRLTAGNKAGLLLPNTTTEAELEHIRNYLPESIKVRIVEEKLSALGNVIVANDHVAIVHPDLDKVNFYIFDFCTRTNF